MKELILLSTRLLALGHALKIKPDWHFKNNASLVGNNIYSMLWTLDNTTATFEVHVKTLGYVGFGISKTGGMADADIVIGWVKNGKAYLQVMMIFFIILKTW